MPNAVIQSAISVAVDKVALGRARGQIDGFASQSNSKLGGIAEVLFKVLAEEISKVEDPLEQAALAQKLFGGAGKELLPTLKGGAAGLAALTERKNNIMSTESVRSAEMVNDAINSTKQAVL